MESIFSLRKITLSTNTPNKEETKNQTEPIIQLKVIKSNNQSEESSSSSDENTNKQEISNNFFKGLLSTVNKVSNKFTRKRTAIQTPSFIDQHHIANLSQEQLLSRGLELLKNQNRSVADNQVVINFLMHLDPFTQTISEVKGDKTKELMSNLSFSLKYSYKSANSLIFRFGDPAEKFYLILDGKVDYLVPNDSIAYLTEAEYFVYLLQLRKYSEMELLNRALMNNNEQYAMNEKSFDIWIKMAYYTILNIRQKQKPIIEQNENGTRRLSRLSIFNLSPRRLSRASQSKIFKLKPRANPDVKIFENKEQRELVMEIENEISSTFSVIDPLSLIPDPGKNKHVSTEDYINRIKPVYLESKPGTERKNVLITTYCVAKSLNSGERFGEMMNDQQLNNEDNKRVGTVITTANTHFGTLNRIYYNDILRDVNEKNRRDQLTFLFGINIFKRANKSLFMKNFSNFFTKKIVKYRDILYKENSVLSNSHCIYFIKEGQFETSSMKSLNEIDEILNKSSLRRYIDQTEIDQLEKMKEYKEKKEYKFQTFGYGDVVGLEDCFWNNKYLFTVTCSCRKAIVFEIQITFFKMLLNLDKVVSENVKQLQIIKRDILLTMLYNQRKAKLFSIMGKKDDNIPIIKDLNIMKTNQKVKKIKINKKCNTTTTLIDNSKSIIEKKKKSIFNFELLDLNKDDKEIFQKFLKRQKQSKTLLSTISHTANLSTGFKTERIKEMSLDHRLKKLKVFEYDIKCRSELSLNPLVYDEFNRRYNTMKYYNTEVDNKRDYEYNIRLTEEPKNRKRKQKLKLSSSIFKNETKDIINMKLNSIYNKKYKRLMYILSNK